MTSIVDEMIFRELDKMRALVPLIEAQSARLAAADRMAEALEALAQEVDARMQHTGAPHVQWASRELARAALAAYRSTT